MILWPATLALVSWNRGQTQWLVAALVGLVISAVPGIAAFARLSWAAMAAETICMAGMVCGLLYVLANSLTIDVLPAAGYALLYAYLSHERMKREKAEKQDKEKERAKVTDDPLEWLRENVEAIAVAFIMALVIRCFCIEVFKIPSSSMETTLLGDRAGPGGHQGDRIMVSKFFYAVEPVSRFDVLVFKFPLDPTRNFIKRVVGLPNEELIVEGGNIFARPTGTETYKLQRKPLRIQRSTWQRLPSPDADLLASPEAFKQVFDTSRQTETPDIRAGLLVPRDSGGTTRYTATGSNDWVPDVAFRGDVQLLEGDGTFYVEIRHDEGIFLLELSATKECRILRDTVQIAGAGGPLSRNRVHEVEFMVYDGSVAAVIDGRTVAEHVFQAEYRRSGRGNDPGMSFGSEKLRFDVRKLDIGRDIHYREKSDRQMNVGRPLVIPANKYVMMGDNVGNSHDSRAWVKYTYTLQNGEKIECESQEATNSEARQRVTERLGKAPDVVIGRDIHGHERWFDDDDVKGLRDEKEFPFVDRDYIIGKAFWIWWPPNRSFRLIR